MSDTSASAQPAVEQLPITLFDSVVLAARTSDGTIWLVLRDLCAALGLALEGQRRRIRTNDLLHLTQLRLREGNQLLGIGASLEQATDRYQQAAFGDMASGTYFAWGKVAKLPQQAQDAGVRQAVWQLLEKLTSDRAPASVEMPPGK